MILENTGHLTLIVRKCFFDVLIFLQDGTVPIKTLVFVKRNYRTCMYGCLQTVFLRRKTDILIKCKPNPLLSDSRIDMQGAPIPLVSIYKAIFTGTISLVHNWTFYKEIAVVYLLSFYSIRAILLP